MNNENERLKIGNEVIIVNTNEKGKIVYIDENTKSYLVSKNNDNNNVQFYNITALEKIE